MILKINPADVVSIPTDYNGAKGRCCKYEVIAQVTGNPADAFTGAVDSTYTKLVVPVADTQPSTWPFPLTPNVTQPTVSVAQGSKYSVVRKNGNDIVATDVDLSDARELVAKNIRQKKASLKILDSNGNEVG